MSLYDEYGEPCGECVICGRETAEDFHLFCGTHYRTEVLGEEERPEPEWRRRRDEERRGADVVTTISDAFGDCVSCGARRLLYPYRQTLRLCIDCLSDRRGDAA